MLGSCSTYLGDKMALLDEAVPDLVEIWDDNDNDYIHHSVMRCLGAIGTQHELWRRADEAGLATGDGYVRGGAIKAISANAKALAAVPVKQESE